MPCSSESWAHAIEREDARNSDSVDSVSGITTTMTKPTNERDEGDQHVVEAIQTRVGGAHHAHARRGLPKAIAALATQVAVVPTAQQSTAQHKAGTYGT